MSTPTTTPEESPVTPATSPPPAAGTAAEAPARRREVAERPATARWVRVARGVRSALAIVTGNGWTLAGLTALCWVAGSITGWPVLTITAQALALLLLLCLVLTIGSDSLTARLSLQPMRVVAGNETSAVVEVTNDGRWRSMPVTVELPIGLDAARIPLRSMAAGGSRQQEFAVPTTRRGVIPVGPLTVLRGDPFGLMRRDRSLADRIELFVHPRLVPMPSLNSGLIRDLEGSATPDPSVADLDFHMLRDYVPGDDQRHVHWKSSARNSMDLGDMKLLMKQYVDTRRSHLSVILDGRLASYRTEDDFEDAVTAAASLSSRAVRDEIDLTVVAGSQVMDRLGHMHTMDGFARVTPGRHDLSELVSHSARIAPGMSVAVIVTGNTQSFVDILRAAAHLPPQVTVVCLRVEGGRRSSTHELQGLKVLNLAKVSDLAKLMTSAGLA